VNTELNSPIYYTVRHITRFRYSAPVRESMMEVRMQPRRATTQHCLGFELITDPRAFVTTSRDYLGNIVHHFDVPRPHKQLAITAQALVTVTPPPWVPGALSPDAWDHLDLLTQNGEGVDMLMPSQFAHPTPLLRQFAQELGVERRDDPLSLVRAINRGLNQAFTYTPESTKADSPIDEALGQRRGVCQDYAHIMTALLREVGIPARYVSGYVYGGTDDPHPSRAAATHAWVEALLPGLGWIGFDPTNNSVVGTEHITVAIGRDYADVPPTRGVFKGQANTELGVAVRVTRGEQLPPDDELLLLMKHLSPPEHAGEQPEQQQQMMTR
jgi:transglutaminase-like putative cysteine protease